LDRSEYTLLRTLSHFPKFFPFPDYLLPLPLLISYTGPIYIKEKERGEPGMTEKEKLKDSTQGVSHLSAGKEEKALALLGQGLSAEVVASAIGVSASRISQLLSREDFSGKVSELRYEALQSHNVRDGKYDSLEDKLLKKLEGSLPLLMKPVDIMRALKLANEAKRRGAAAPVNAQENTTIVQLVLPKQITQQFALNIDNQVVAAGEQSLVTMQSGELLNLGKQREAERIEKFGDSDDMLSTI
jgi:hypothetical protein